MKIIEAFADSVTPYGVEDKTEALARQRCMDFQKSARGCVGIWGNHPNVVIFQHVEDALLYELTYL